MREYADTIAAIATALGEAAISVVRISGPDALKITRKIFRQGREKRKEYTLKERYAHYGFIVDPETEEVLDEVILIYYRAPRSYTTEDMVEIMCHGGFVTPRVVLKACLKAGARLAEPGEFTKRAFLGGRLDLTQAEAVLEIIHARGREHQRLALDQLSGGLRRKILDVKGRLQEVLMLVEASVDFPEEEIEFLDPEDLSAKIREAIDAIEELIKGFDSSQALRTGIPIAIVGRPNVGKSSLLNALLKEERAIVSQIPGTTRDTIEEEISIKGHVFRLIDTAGIRRTEDPVEQLGVERSKQKLKEAELVIMVIDASEPLTDEDRFIAELIADRPHIVVLNKWDLDRITDEEGVRKLGLTGPVVKTSALMHTGIEELQEAIIKEAGLAPAKTPGLVNERHLGSLVRAQDSLKRCLETIEAGLSNEFIAIDLKEAMNALGEITGEVTTDDILNQIFERFCIGK